MRLRAAIVAGLTLLASCGRGEDSVPGGLSTSEQSQLNDAAAMLDANSVETKAVTENARD